MNQREVNRAVAAATGETVSTIAELGFSLADPSMVTHDPEPCDADASWEAKTVDWDELDAERRVPIVSQPAA